MKNIGVTEIEIALIEASGNIAEVARRFGVVRGTIQYRIDNSPVLQKVLHDSRETMLDNAESVMYKKVLQGSTPELIFFLKTQGRSRGYVERIEQEHSGLVELVVKKAYVNVSPDEWPEDKADSSL